MIEKLTARAPRARTRRATIGAAVLTALLAATAVAMPPGGPAENRNGASITLDARIVTPGGTVSFTGSGFNEDEVIRLLLDDGLTLPQTPDPAGEDVFDTFTADEEGEIEGTLDLSTVKTSDLPKVNGGSHRLRFLSGPPPRSIHVDFAIRPLTGPPEVLNGSSAFIAPPATQLLEFPGLNDSDAPYVDVPKLVAGSVVPFRFHDFKPGQVVTLKRNDGAANDLQVTADAGGDGAGYVAVDTSTPETSWIRFLAGADTPDDATDNRSIRAPYEVIANEGGRNVAVAAKAEQGGSLAFTGTGLARSPEDYIPITPVGQTVVGQIEGQAGTVTATAAADGKLSGGLPVPAALPLGAHKAVFWIGFAKQSDFPQAVFVREFEVVAASKKDDPPKQPPVEEPKVVAPKISSKKLVVRKGKITLVVAPGSKTAKAAVTIRTVKKVKLKKGAKAKRVLVAKGTVTLKTGAKTRKVSVKLTKQGKQLLKRVKSVRVALQVRPRGSKVIGKKLKLSR